MGIIAGLGRGMPGRPGAPPSRAAGGRGIAASPGALRRRRGPTAHALRGRERVVAGPRRRRRDGRQAWGPGPSPRRQPGRRPVRRPAVRPRRPAGPGPPARRRGCLAGPGLGAAGAAGAAASRARGGGCRCLGGRRRSLGGLRLGRSRRLGGLLGRLRSGEEGLAVLLLEPHLDGKLDRRGGRLDELAHLLQLLENFLALDAVGLGEFVNSGLSHVSPSGLETRVPADMVSARGFETVMGGANSSESTHRVLMSCLLQSLVGVSLRSDGAGRAVLLRTRLRVQCRDVLPHRLGGQPRAGPKGPGERSPPHREVVARRRGMQVCSPARRGGCRIGYDDRSAVRVRSGDHPQQLALRGPLPAPDACSDGSPAPVAGRSDRRASHFLHLSRAAGERLTASPAAAVRAGPRGRPPIAARHAATSRLGRRAARPAEPR